MIFVGNRVSFHYAVESGDVGLMIIGNNCPNIETRGIQNFKTTENAITYNF